MVEFLMDVWCHHYDDQVQEHTRIGLSPDQLLVLLQDLQGVLTELRTEYFDATGHYGSDKEVLDHLTKRMGKDARDA